MFEKSESSTSRFLARYANVDAEKSGSKVVKELRLTSGRITGESTVPLSGVCECLCIITGVSWTTSCRSPRTLLTMVSRRASAEPAVDHLQTPYHPQSSKERLDAQYYRAKSTSRLRDHVGGMSLSIWMWTKEYHRRCRRWLETSSSDM